MNLIADLLSRFRRKPRAWWQAFDVSFDEHSVVIRERCPRKVREERFSWSSVRRVCFKDRGLSSDVFFVFTADRDGAFMVPVEAKGGNAFWDALRQRRLFPDEISAAAIRSTDGAYYCWPEEEFSE